MQAKEHDFFKSNNYIKIENFITKDLCNIFNNYAIFQNKYDHTPETGEDAQILNTHARYADFFTESLLLYFKNKIEDIIGEPLLPTYSYYRVYKQGDVLEPHLDRPACEISITMALSEDIWPFYVINAFKEDDKNVKTIMLAQGDALIYSGMKVVHWRERLTKPQHVQIFLHYVREHGQHRNCAYDGRNDIGVPKFSKQYEYVKHSKWMQMILENI